MSDPTPFDRWYAANARLAKNNSKGALRAAWDGAVYAAILECGRAGRAARREGKDLGEAVAHISGRIFDLTKGE